VSIVRVGLAETKGYSDGYDAIFGGKKKAESQKSATKPKAATGKKEKKSKKK
jgi:hypothetical protein